MRCPFCSNDDTQVKDSRPADDNSSIRRRRQCSLCLFNSALKIVSQGDGGGARERRLGLVRLGNIGLLKFEKL